MHWCCSQSTVVSDRAVFSLLGGTHIKRGVAGAGPGLLGSGAVVGAGAASTDAHVCAHTPDADVEKNVTVAVTTDKGLCGGINSTVCRYVRGMSSMYAAGALLRSGRLVVTACFPECQLRPEAAPWGSAEEGKNQNIFVIGDKGRAQLTRTHGKDVKEVVQDVGKIRITFSQVRLKDLAGLPQQEPDCLCLAAAVKTSICGKACSHSLAMNSSQLVGWPCLNLQYDTAACSAVVCSVCFGAGLEAVQHGLHHV